MKLKLKLMGPLLWLLFLTVVSPLFFYTDTLTTFSSSSWSSSSPSAKDQFIDEISKLWQENSAALKELVVNLDSSSSKEKDVHNSRQLQQDLESVEHKSRVLSDAKSHSDQSDVRNPIRLVTDQVQPENQSDVLRLHEAKIDQGRRSVYLNKEISSIVFKQTS